MTRAGRFDEKRLEDARLMFEQMLGYANHLGLYAEETGARGEALGNFPQAFTHLALISSATLLDLHDRKGEKALKGTNTDRAKRVAGATAGFKALIFALIRNKSIRLRSSRKSVLAMT